MAKSKYLLFGDGESPHVLKWVRELTRWFDVHLVSSRDVGPELARFLPRDRIDTLRQAVREEGGNFALLGSLPRLRKILREVRPRFVNAHYVTSHGFLMALLKKTFSEPPFILIQSAWGTDILVTPFRGGLYRLVTRFALGEADLVTSDSEYMTRVIERLGGQSVLTFPFGLEKMPGLDPGKKIPGLFFSNRSLTVNSRVDRIISLVGRISRDKEDAALVVANEGKERPALETSVRDAGLEDRVRFVGYLSREEQEGFYEKARFYVSLPGSDATSVSLLEAMAHGCVPIVSDLPANREWVKHGENGLIYHDGLSLSDIGAMERNWAAVAERNRRIIAERALFPERIRSMFIPRLHDLAGPAREADP